MIEKDLEETKPIKKLSDLVDSRSDRYDMDNQEVTRSEKYEDVLIDELPLTIIPSTGTVSPGLINNISSTFISL